MSNKNDLRPNSIAFSMDSYKTKDEFWKAVAEIITRHLLF